MALSTNTYTYAGGAQTFVVNFALGFIQRSDVTVRVNSAVDGTGDPVYSAFTWIDDSNITVTPTLTIGDSVKLERTVSNTELKVNFAATSDVTPANLDLSAKHGLMLYQELVDGRVAGVESPEDAADRAVAQAAAASVSAAAALVSEGLADDDRVATNADAVLTAADVVLTDADATATAADRIAVAADLVQTNLDTIATAADVVSAEADKVQTGLDRIAVAADLVSTDADQIASAASAALALVSENASAAYLAASKGGTPASVSLSVLNVEGAALDRFDLTRQGTGSGNVIQGFAIDPYLGELYTIHDTSSTAVINKFQSDGVRTQTSSHWNSTPTATVGHQQLDICWDKDGARWFWTAENYAVTNATRYIKRFQVADGAGTELTISNQEQFKVWGDDVSGTGSATVATSVDGKYLITEHTGAGNTNRIRVFDLPAMMLGGAGDYSAAALFEWTIELNTTTYPLQGMACDGSVIYIFTGNIATGPTLKVFAYSLSGSLIQEIDDFTVGETAARADDTGTDAYELEGAGWVWNGGQPFLAVATASGDSGSRTARIWALGANLPVTAYGNGNRPAFLAQGGNDFGVPAGEVMRLGHYDPTADTFTEGASINTSNQFNFTAVSGTWTPVISDSTTGGNLGTASVSNAVYRNIGGMIYAKCKLTNIGTAGMSGGANIYVQGLPIAAESDSDGIMSFSGFTPDGSGIGIVPSVDSGKTYFKFKELIGGGTYVNANVNQFASGSADVWITIVYPS